MNISLLKSNNAPRLILIFAGWASLPEMFAALRVPQGYDLAVAYGYIDTTLSGDAGAFQFSGRYREIVVLGWSFGVAVADVFLSAHPELPVTLSIAVNGSVNPCHDEIGIPRAIYQATRRGLSEQSLRRFMRRVCGSASRVAEAYPTADAYSIAALGDELDAVARLTAGCELPRLLWTVAYISSSDAIFPVENLRRAWTGHPDVREIAGPHLPPFQTIIDCCVVKKDLVAERFGQSVTTYARSATVQAEAARHLYSMVAGYLGQMRPLRVIEVGPGSGFLTGLYGAKLAAKSELQLWDVVPISAELPGNHATVDAETAIMDVADGSVDAIISASTIQWFNNPALFLRRALGKLAPGGVLAVSTFGDRNFEELDGILPTHHYPSAECWLKMLPDGAFEIEERTNRMEFASPRELLNHLRLTGVNAVASSAKEAVTAALRITRSGVRSLTYHQLFLIHR